MKEDYTQRMDGVYKCVSFESMADILSRVVIAIHQVGTGNGE
jgi:hypothetical protein